MGYEDDTTIARFINDELPQMRLPGLITQTWQLRESAGPATSRRRRGTAHQHI